ncbi:MAG: DNA gyrase subunit A [Clostridia bacterium]|nr:DNA gyrase subunit A [Clostridia bacterium]
MCENKEPVRDRILPVNMQEEMKISFISYAMAVITSRALPDVRDGLKPVHRRILHSMNEIGVGPDKPHKKSARIVGECLGKYHPHGDSSVYDAMVRLAQPFSMRYTLVDGHGNFGSIDGDGAAAMRYTEARLSKLAVEMLADIDKDTVDMTPNFDGEEMEPTVLPSRIPNLLVNGSGGIAVGMATNMPPHNLCEVVDGLIALIDDPDITVDELMQYIPGPDFPTGAIIMGRSGIAQAYRTGRGKITVRAKTDIEEYGHGRYRIVVSEIPYQINKAKMVEHIAELVKDKRIEGISDLRDESDYTGMRVVIELKKEAQPNVVLNQLFKHSELQTGFSINNLALVDGEPKTLNLKELLYHYLRHRAEVVTRRTKFDLNKAQERLHIVQGLLTALDHIDEIVELIKKSANTQEAKAKLMERFGFSEVQAQAILDMRLARLTGLERGKLEDERAGLLEKIAYYKSILEDESMLMTVIKEEALDVKNSYGDARKTEINNEGDEDCEDDAIREVRDMVVTMTHDGYIKCTEPDVFRAQRRGGRGVKGQGTKEEDFVEKIFFTSTHAPILFFTNMGRVFSKKCYAFPEGGRTDRGKPIVNYLQLEAGEKITATVPLPANPDPESYLVLCTRQGVIKKTPLSEFDNIRRTGLIAVKLREDDELIAAEFSGGNDEFIVASRGGKAVRFDENDVRDMGRTATGVRAMTLENDDVVVDMVKVVPDATVLTVTELGMGKRTETEEYPAHRRGGKGLAVMKLTEKTGLLKCLRMVKEDEDLMLIRDDGTLMRMPIAQINVIGRTTQGVRLMRVDEGTRIAAIAIVPHSEDAEDETEVTEIPVDETATETVTAEAETAETNETEE